MIIMIIKMFVLSIVVMTVSLTFFVTVSVFEMKDYKLPRGHKKHKPLCRPCGKGFKDWPTYNTHMQEKHRAQTEWTCKLCDKVQQTLSGYNNHMLMHYEDAKKKVCEKCQSHFTYQSQLDCHMVKHNNDKLHKCPSKVCNREGSKEKASLDCHIEQHSGELIPCLVEGCPKTFKSRHYRTDHMNNMHGPVKQCRNVL